MMLCCSVCSHDSPSMRLLGINTAQQCSSSSYISCLGSMFKEGCCWCVSARNIAIYFLLTFSKHFETSDSASRAEWVFFMSFFYSLKQVPPFSSGESCHDVCLWDGRTSSVCPVGEDEWGWAVPLPPLIQSEAVWSQTYCSHTFRD